MTHFAHTLPPPATRASWEPLLNHLRWVAEGDETIGLEGAARFAKAFGAGQWGRVAGWWHDLGKYSDAFQSYMATANDPHTAEVRGTIDHSSAGAQYAADFGACGLLIAYAIAGHHAGLTDAQGGRSSLDGRLRKQIEPWKDEAPQEALAHEVPSRPPVELVTGDPTRAAFSLAFFTRMLFSCLVDADFLATEAFMNRDRAQSRPRKHASITTMLGRLNEFLNDLTSDSAPTNVNVQRARVLQNCRDKASLPPGLFSLNVPTGGGKTLASLAFALTHAKQHGLRRVVYAIPFTSIVEQTAEVFRDKVGLDVLEVHSSLDPDDADKQTTGSRLAAENFDSPLVVTTNVQLLESLFANRTSKCRKLHRLAGSVIIFDEAQTLPPNLLKPTLWALDELAKNYGCSIVLCTATQPAVVRRKGFDIGLENVTEIIDGGDELHRALKRVDVRAVGELDDADLVTSLAAKRQVLCIVNTRRQARDLASSVGKSIHLSANQCAAHRSKIVTKIRQRLAKKQSCRVISTAVIEAGVDVDFPVVFRAMAGLDSIAQAAGRCNREGRHDVGNVIVFEPTHDSRPPEFVRTAADAARNVFPDHVDDLLSPAAIEDYFREFYWKRRGDDNKPSWDAGIGAERTSVCGCFDIREGMNFQFRKAAAAYRLIDDAQSPVLVPWGRGRRLRAQLQTFSDNVDPMRLRRWDRKAQRYTVGMFEHERSQLMESGAVRECMGRFFLDNDDAYDRRLGLLSNVEGMNANDLVV